MPNWQVALAIGLSVVMLVGLFMTNEEPIIQDDTFDPIAPVLELEEPPDPAEVDLRTSGIDETAERLARQRARLRAQDEAAEQTRQREQAVAAQRAAAQLRRARAQAERLRGQPSQPELDYSGSDALALSADHTSLVQALELEDRQRQADALRAPAVVSSARGIGERSHAIEPLDVPVSLQAPPRGRGPAPAPAAPSLPFPAAPGAPSPFPAPSVPVVPPRVSPALPRPTVPVPGGVSMPPLPGRLPVPAVSAVVQPSFAGGPLGQGALFSRDPAPVPGGPDVVSGLGAPVAQHVGAEAPLEAPIESTFTLGPRADGGLAEAVGVIVDPDDGRNHRLYEGTLIPAALQTQLNGQYSGPLSAQVTRSVWSDDRSVVLIPRGTVALGTSGSVTGVFQDRLAVTFHRLIFPDGRWLELGFAGLNGLGETSLKDQVNRHYLQLFGTAGAVGLLAGFTDRNTSGQQGFRSSVSEQMANTSLQILGQYLNRRPDITIRAGHRVNVWLTSDVLVPMPRRR